MEQVIVNEYFNRAFVSEVYDGDTVTVNLNLGYNVRIFDIKIRLLDVYAPEIRTSDPEEKKMGLKVRDFLRELILEKDIYVMAAPNWKKGSWHRYLGTLYTLEGKNINEMINSFMEEMT